MTPVDNDVLIDILWKMYAENTTQARHHETQRSTVTNLILLAAGSILALTTVDKRINDADVPATILVVALGLFGIVFSAEHYARTRQHLERSKQYRVALDRLLPSLDDPGLAAITNQMKNEVREALKSDPLGNGILTALKRAGDHAHKTTTIGLGVIPRGGLHSLWLGLHFLIVILGTSLTVIALWHEHSWS